MSTETIRLIRDGEKPGGGGMEVGEEGEYIPIATLSPPALIKVGSDESHFNVSLTVRDKVTRPCPQTTTFEEKAQPKAVSNRGPSAYTLPLGQTGTLACDGVTLKGIPLPAPPPFGFSPAFLRRARLTCEQSKVTDSLCNWAHQGLG